MKLKYSEIFLSLQGEGKYVGQPSVFLRMFGCNFTCSGFGHARGQIPKKEDEDRSKINPDDYENFEDLPLVARGCDSFASWDPRFKKFIKTATIDEMVDLLTDAAPNKQWNNTGPAGTDTHLIITGGEPLLSWQKAYPELLEKLADRGLKHLTFETNGTQPLRPEFKEWFAKNDRIKITWSVSPKLSISGHSFQEAIKPYNIKDYSNQPNKDTLFLKFVVGDLTDFEEMQQAVKAYLDVGAVIDNVFAMPVGGTIEGLQLTEKQVADLCVEHGIRFTPRLHVNIWGNSWGK